MQRMHSEQVRKRLDQNAPLFGSAALSAGMILARVATPVRKRNELYHLTGSPIPAWISRQLLPGTRPRVSGRETFRYVAFS